MEPLNGETTVSVTIVQSVDQAGEGLVMQLTGELDLSNVDKLRHHLDELVAAGPERLVIEIGGLTFMDSTGIALLVEMSQEVGTLVLRHPSDLIRRVLEATGVSEILRLES
jgi:anti-anti-sigma factor